MVRESYKYKKNMSLRTIIKKGMAVIAILLFGFCVFFIHSVWKQINNYEISAYTGMLQLHSQAIENEIGKMQEDLAVVASTNQSLSALKKLQPGTDYNFQKLQINRELREILNRYSYINGIFIIDETNRNMISQYNSGSSYAEMTEIKELFESKLENGVITENRNFIECVNDEWYYFYILPAGEVDLGGWCNLDGLFSFAEGEQYPFTGVSCELNGAYYQKSSKITDMIVQVTGDITNIRYSLYLSRSEISAAIFRLMIGYISICAAIFAVVILMLIWITNHVVRPISYIEHELSIIGADNLEHRIEKTDELTEFQMLYDSLNEMLEQVCRLKIQVYEEKMEKQKIYTSYLTLQMNPHFYVNSLNVIHSLAKMKNYALIEKMTSCLSGYLNYMFRKDDKVATIGEELDHIYNFLDIQRIRYAENFTFQPEVTEPDLYEARIPILLLHTFIENSVKYSQNSIQDLQIRMQIRKEGAPSGTEKVIILFSDNGGGFEEKVLEQLNENSAILKSDGEHIGIKNLRERALQYFEDQFKICFYNDGGACVRLEFLYVKE